MHELTSLFFIVGNHIVDLAGDVHGCFGNHGTGEVIQRYVCPTSRIEIFNLAQLPIDNPAQDGGDGGGYGGHGQWYP
jgi:hypothetical protein